MIRNWGIRSRVLLLALVPVICLGILLGTYLTRVRVLDLQTSEHVLGDTLANQLASASEYGVTSNNVRILETLAHTVAQEPGVEAITITDRNNNVLVQVTQPTIESQGLISNISRRVGAETGLASTLTFTRSILLRSNATGNPAHFLHSSGKNNKSQSNNYQVIGKVTVKLSEARFAERQTQIIVNGGIIILSCLVFSIILALVIGGSVAVPITRVIAMVSRFSGGDHGTRVPERSGGEIGQLESGINLMAANAERSQQELQVQINQATAELQETMNEMEVKNVELDLARKRALEASRVKSEFLSNMSHEIRTPMNAIVGFAGLLAKTRLNKDQHYYLDTVQHSASILLTLIDDVLGLQSIEAGRPIQPMEFGLRELLEETVQLLAPDAYKKELELAVNIPADIPNDYMGDAVKLSRVIINLLSNAVKFTEHGQVLLNVGVISKHAHSVTLFISVLDSGIGIRKEHINDLFKPFTMLNTSTDKRYSGTGLGLAISRQLMDTLGGSLSVSSHAGIGSEFRVELTLNVVDAPQRLLPAGQGKHVLLYESHHAMSAAIQSRLKVMGYSVISCSSLNRLSVQLRSANIRHYSLLLLSLSYQDVRDCSNIRDLVMNKSTLPKLILINSLECNVQNKIADAINGVCLPKCVDTPVLEKKIRQLLPRQMPAPKVRPRTPTTCWQPLAGHRVLVIEDNRINRNLIVLQLRALGAEVYQAENGVTALACFREIRPQAILMDMRLEHETGLDIAKILAAAAGEHPVPVIMLSATRAEAPTEISRTLGICRWLLKPVDEQVLADALLSVLETKQSNKSSEDDSRKILNTALINLRPEILDMLYQDLPVQQQAVFNAWEQDDVATLQEALHVLHGTAALCKLSELNAYCNTIENILGKQLHIADIQPYKSNLKKEIDRIITLLEMRNHTTSSYTDSNSITS
ncbi:MAG TPA: ATP-binding protein [Gammaproteobacteria bacterium]|nr:ATP-binding protein [Gammaproteobacteria bacterium]